MCVRYPSRDFFFFFSNLFCISLKYKHFSDVICLRAWYIISPLLSRSRWIIKWTDTKYLNSFESFCSRMWKRLCIQWEFCLSTINDLMVLSSRVVFVIFGYWYFLPFHHKTMKITARIVQNRKENLLVTDTIWHHTYADKRQQSSDINYEPGYLTHMARFFLYVQGYYNHHMFNEYHFVGLKNKI